MTVNHIVIYSNSIVLLVSADKCDKILSLLDTKTQKLTRTPQINTQ